MTGPDNTQCLRTKIEWAIHSGRVGSLHSGHNRSVGRYPYRWEQQEDSPGLEKLVTNNVLSHVIIVLARSTDRSSTLHLKILSTQLNKF